MRPLIWGWVALTVYIGFFNCCSVDANLVPDDIKQVTHVVKGGMEIYVDDRFEFQMFCRVGEKKHVAYYFRTATLRITSAADDIKLVKGYSPADVYLQYTQSTRWLLWIANILPWRSRDTHFPTFNTSCVGISTTRAYASMVIIRPVDPWRVFTLVGGILLFFLAPRLSHSTLFFYSSGTLLGGLAAALIVLFVLTRILPKGKSGYFLLSVIYSVAFYFAGETWKRFEELIHERLPYIVAYLFTGALVAFLACYRWGPPKHPRTLDIIRWSLQAMGLVLIHFSSDFVEMSTAIIILVLVYHHSNLHLKYYLERYYRRWFPPQRRLLTEEEYINQGVIETQKGLKELRSFCSSPESKPWKLVAKLRNPRRFSSFMEGSSHLIDDEILAYDSDEELTYGSKSLSFSASNHKTPRSKNGSVLLSTDIMVVTDDEESDQEQLDCLETDDDD